MCDTFLSASQLVFVVVVVWQGQVTCNASQVKVQTNQVTALSDMCRVEYVCMSLGGFACEVKVWMALHVVSLYPTLAPHTSPTNHTCTYVHVYTCVHTPLSSSRHCVVRFLLIYSWHRHLKRRRKRRRSNWRSSDVSETCLWMHFLSLFANSHFHSHFGYIAPYII